jgi:hypothetical protein
MEIRKARLLGGEKPGFFEKWVCWYKNEGRWERLL